jgi:pimeloyl-ACP methyl ester carboxylesterase
MDFDKDFYFGKIRISRHDNYPDRPTIVFLHDSLGCIELWQQFPQRLGELTKCNVFTYDRLGYGKSGLFISSKRNNDYMEIEAKNLSEILEKCSIDKAILFGHSDGGSISLIAGGKYPSRILGIITEGAHIFVEDITLQGIIEAANKYRTTDLKTKLAKYHGDNTEQMFWAWASTWTTEVFKTWNIEHFLPLIKCPCLIIQGDKDEYGTELQVDRIMSQTNGKSTNLFYVK